ncbi:MAG TPA: ABC transporter permease [Acidimicrobiales bacterium]|jgi:branched-chain amino acid transport system permease protein|nr:ABC transporter permease [Acidimicrobiales bacterium]
MFQYVLAGLALGSIYAIASSSVVVTFVSAGVLNFAFGAMAYFIARFFYWLNSQHGWPTGAAGVVSILVVGPLLGVVLYGLLFRFVRGKSTLVKLVATIGLSVALPPIADITMGTQSIDQPPGLGLMSDHFLGTSLTSDQVFTYVFLILLLVAGTVVLRFTDIGLKVRALVDSEALTSMSGTNPGRVALGVWAVSSTLAGLAGILIAPTNGLTAEAMTLLMAGAFAAVVVARLRSLPLAVGASLLMGLVTDVPQKYLPPNSSFTSDFIGSVPFGFILLALVYYLLRSGYLDEGAGVAGPLDQAIRPAHLDSELNVVAASPLTRAGAGLNVLPLLAVAALPLIFHGSSFWLGQTAQGLCYAVTFLGFTMVTGEGGMLWLSQITFGGAGALGGAELANVLHIPILLAVVGAGVLAALAGAIIGLLTIRLGDLYVALATLTFGLLVDSLLFTLNVFYHGGQGLLINRPGFLNGDMAFAYFALAVFAVFALLIVNLRRSTSGMALRAVRDSETASRTLGLSVMQVKVIVGSLAAMVTAIGGGLLAIQAGQADPANYDVFAGLAWLAVVVTMGARSITGAAVAGLSFTLMQAVFQQYVPTRWHEVPAVLFGLGAIGVARNPEGVIAQNARQLRQLITGARGVTAHARPGSVGAAIVPDPAGLKAEAAK